MDRAMQGRGTGSDAAGPTDAATTGDGTPVRRGLFQVVRERMRRLGLSLRTERAYLAWIRRFVAANGRRHPRELGAPEVEAFLTMLAVRDQVAGEVGQAGLVGDADQRAADRVQGGRAHAGIA